ncbi:MAG: GntR family transcriptional regulator [Trueperaceae bacterium]
MNSSDLDSPTRLPRQVEFTNAPLRLRIASVLRDAILEGDLRPGAPLTETALAEQLEVSRAPVREAIRILAKEGLIDSEPYRGSRVRTLDRRDVEEVYSLRGLHESFAVERIVQGSAPDGLDDLTEICERMRRHADAGDMRAVSAEDERFHRRMIELADHTLLASIWAQLSLRVRQIMSLRNLQIEDPHRVAENHVLIVEALRSKQLDVALERVRDHVREGTQLVIDGWSDPS